MQQNTIRRLTTAFLAAGWLLAAATGFAQAQQNTRIVCFGDSITAGIDLDRSGEPIGTPDSGYLPFLKAYLDANWRQVKLENDGVLGLDSTEAAGRINGVLSGGYDYLLLLIGTNDVHHIVDGEISSGLTASNIEFMAQTALSRGVTPVLATLLPRSAFSVEETVVQQINSLIKRIGSQLGVPVADQHANFAGRHGVWLYSNILHPNLTGYQAMAEEWASVLTDTPIRRIDLISPYIEYVEPFSNQTNVSPVPEIRATIGEDGSGLDTDNIIMKVNGEDVPWSVKETGSRFVVSYTVQEMLPFHQQVDVKLEVQDRATPPNGTTARWSFTVTGGNGTKGDVNGSGSVDGVDLILLGSAFGSAQGDPDYKPNVDFDESRFIDGVDLSILTYYFEH